MITPSLLKESFPKDEFPALPCPNCGASLKLDVKALLEVELAASSAAYDDGAIDYEDRCSVFAGMLRCVAANCREAVAVCGKGTNERTFRRGTEEMDDLLNPQFFEPTLQIFIPPDKTPTPITEALGKSFRMFWSNPSAAGNALRVAVEHLMDYEKVRIFPVGSRKRADRLTLHRRILNYASVQPDRANLLMAVKWIGNGGSHQAELKRRDVIHGYKILEQVLSEMFDDAKAVSRLAKQIVRAKGPLKESKK